MIKNKPYYIYNDLCKKIEKDSIDISEKDKEINILKKIVDKSDISINSLVDMLIKEDLSSEERQYINNIINNKIKKKGMIE